MIHLAKEALLTAIVIAFCAGFAGALMVRSGNIMPFIIGGVAIYAFRRYRRRS